MGAVTDNQDSRNGSTAAHTAPASPPEAGGVAADRDRAETQDAPRAEAGPRAGAQPADQADEQPAVPQLTRKQADKVHAPARAMILSMGALLLIVVPLFLLMPRPDAEPYRPDVDVAQEADNAAEAAEFQPLAPDLGEGWSPNYARWNGQSADGVAVWEAGWVTPRSGFLSMAQTDQSNPTWVLEQIDGLPQTGTVEAAGTQWQVHFGEDAEEEPRTAWIGEVDGTTVILQGSAPDAEFDHAANAVVDAASDDS